MTQDKAHPTPPAVPSEREAFEAWAVSEEAELSITKIRNEACNIEAYACYETFKAWTAWQAAIAHALAAPVASNTTAEPAPIQPAEVKVEEAEPDLTIAYMCGFSDGKKARLGAAGVEVERDAARYRWLRLNGVPQVVEPNGYGLGAATGSQLDEMIDHTIAIDQALAAASQGDRGKT